MKRLLILCLYLFVVVSCSNSRDSENTPRNHLSVAKKELSSLSEKDKAIVKKQNEAIKTLHTGEYDTSSQVLKNLIPEIKTIENKKQRNFTLMSTYMATEMYPEAYALNEAQLAEKPTPERQMFKCTLLATMKEDEKKIQGCHEVAADKIKLELDQTANTDPIYNSGLAVYYMEKYKAGHLEYKQKIRELIAATQNETEKNKLNDFYEGNITE